MDYSEMGKNVVLHLNWRLMMNMSICIYIYVSVCMNACVHIIVCRHVHI